VWGVSKDSIAKHAKFRAKYAVSGGDDFSRKIVMGASPQTPRI